MLAVPPRGHFTDIRRAYPKKKASRGHCFEISEAGTQVERVFSSHPYSRHSAAGVGVVGRPDDTEADCPIQPGVEHNRVRIGEVFLSTARKKHKAHSSVLLVFLSSRAFIARLRGFGLTSWVLDILGGNEGLRFSAFTVSPGVLW